MLADAKPIGSVLRSLFPTPTKGGAILGGIGAAAAQRVGLELQQIETNVTNCHALVVWIVGVEIVSACTTVVEDLYREHGIAVLMQVASMGQRESLTTSTNCTRMAVPSIAAI